MKNYSATDILRVAKRFNNRKRNYLLVNPLQGKHLPTSPTAALDMMSTLGERVAENFPSAKLVIGFAETATAIGAAVAKTLSDDCFYLQTTRETFDGNFVEFLEEHSHAPEQKLFAENFNVLLNDTPEVIFIDDELSTGKTLLNIVRRLKSEFPELVDKKICAASIINRLSEENLSAFAAENISCEYLVKLPQTPFDVERFTISPAQDVKPCGREVTEVLTCKISTNPRRGTTIGEFFSQCETVGDKVAEMFVRRKISGEVVTIGTEEFMLPAIIIGRRLQRENLSVVTHSTTRSPIGVSTDENYPIREGYGLRSFYDDTRRTFIYNPKFYDAAVIVTDAQNFSAGLDDLIAALNVHGVGEIFIVRC
ncbi:MAG: phosphoribosyltransferase family protein [Selenomonadaceae bacterium]|nr:phosphoribosyltransferase family protein [Selenomonadaceae bacterium]